MTPNMQNMVSYTQRIDSVNNPVGDDQDINQGTLHGDKVAGRWEGQYLSTWGINGIMGWSE